jgi:hypothetical protein
MRPRIVELLDLAFLDLQLGVIDRSSVDARRSSGLEARNGKPDFLQLLGQVGHGIFAGTPTGYSSVGTDVNAAAQKCTGGDDDAPRTESSSFESLDSDHSGLCGREQKTRDGSLNCLHLFLLLDE